MATAPHHSQQPPPVMAPVVESIPPLKSRRNDGKNRTKQREVLLDQAELRQRVDWLMVRKSRADDKYQESLKKAEARRAELEENGAFLRDKAVILGEEMVKPKHGSHLHQIDSNAENIRALLEDEEKADWRHPDDRDVPRAITMEGSGDGTTFAPRRDTLLVDEASDGQRSPASIGTETTMSASVPNRSPVVSEAPPPPAHAVTVENMHDIEVPEIRYVGYGRTAPPRRDITTPNQPHKAATKDHPFDLPEEEIAVSVTMPRVQAVELGEEGDGSATPSPQRPLWDLAPSHVKVPRPPFEASRAHELAALFNALKCNNLVAVDTIIDQEMTLVNRKETYKNVVIEMSPTNGMRYRLATETPKTQSNVVKASRTWRVKERILEDILLGNFDLDVVAAMQVKFEETYRELYVLRQMHTAQYDTVVKEKMRAHGLENNLQRQMRKMHERRDQFMALAAELQVLMMKQRGTRRHSSIAGPDGLSSEFLGMGYSSWAADDAEAPEEGEEDTWGELSRMLEKLAPGSASLEVRSSEETHRKLLARLKGHLSKKTKRRAFEKRCEALESAAMEGEDCLAAVNSIFHLGEKGYVRCRDVVFGKDTSDLVLHEPPNALAIGGEMANSVCPCCQFEFDPTKPESEYADGINIRRMKAKEKVREAAERSVSKQKGVTPGNMASFRREKDKDEKSSNRSASIKIMEPELSKSTESLGATSPPRTQAEDDAIENVIMSLSEQNERLETAKAELLRSLDELNTQLEASEVERETHMLRIQELEADKQSMHSSTSQKFADLVVKQHEVEKERTKFKWERSRMMEQIDDLQTKLTDADEELRIVHEADDKIDKMIVYPSDDAMDRVAITYEDLAKSKYRKVCSLERQLIQLGITPIEMVDQNPGPYAPLPEWADDEAQTEETHNVTRDAMVDATVANRANATQKTPPPSPRECGLQTSRLNIEFPHKTRDEMGADADVIMDRRNLYERMMRTADEGGDLMLAIIAIESFDARQLDDMRKKHAEDIAKEAKKALVMRDLLEESQIALKEAQARPATLEQPVQTMPWEPEKLPAELIERVPEPWELEESETNTRHLLENHEGELAFQQKYARNLLIDLTLASIQNASMKDLEMKLRSHIDELETQLRAAIELAESKPETFEFGAGPMTPPLSRTNSKSGSPHNIDAISRRASQLFGASQNFEGTASSLYSQSSARGLPADAVDVVETSEATEPPLPLTDTHMQTSTQFTAQAGSQASQPASHSQASQGMPPRSPAPQRKKAVPVVHTAAQTDPWLPPVIRARSPRRNQGLSASTRLAPRDRLTLNTHNLEIERHSPADHDGQQPYPTSFVSPSMKLPSIAQYLAQAEAAAGPAEPGKDGAHAAALRRAAAASATRQSVPTDFVFSGQTALSPTMSPKVFEAPALQRTSPPRREGAFGGMPSSPASIPGKQVFVTGNKAPSPHRKHWVAFKSPAKITFDVIKANMTVKRLNRKIESLEQAADSPSGAAGPTSKGKQDAQLLHQVRDKVLTQVEQWRQQRLEMLNKRPPYQRKPAEKVPDPRFSTATYGTKKHQELPRREGSLFYKKLSEKVQTASLAVLDE